MFYSESDSDFNFAISSVSELSESESGSVYVCLITNRHAMKFNA